MGLCLNCLKSKDPNSSSSLMPNDNMLMTNQKFSSTINHQQITKDDFEYIKVLGRGTFGKVYLVRHKSKAKSNNKQLLAMKVLKKSVIIEKNEVIHTRTERKLLEKITHPFIVEFHFAFQDAKHLYLVTEFMQGGELFFHLHKERYFTNERMKFYACEVVLALGYLHEQKFIYRDLKLENILLDKDGHIKLTDFGLSKLVDGSSKSSKPKTLCGTPEYLAPEILQVNDGKTYDKAVDWWSFGVLLYEMLTGKSPLKIGKVPTMYDYYVPIEFPNHIEPEAKSLLEGLLMVEPEKRLGYGPKGTQNVKAHVFFKDVNWDDVLKKRIKPPFCPTILGEIDITNFNAMFTNEKLDFSTIDGGDLLAPSLKAFPDFSFVKDQGEYDGDGEGNANGNGSGNVQGQGQSNCIVPNSDDDDSD